MMTAKCFLLFLITSMVIIGSLEANNSFRNDNIKVFVPRVKKSHEALNGTNIGIDLVAKLTDETAKCLTTQHKNLIAIPRSFYQAQLDLNSRTTMKVATANNFLMLSDGLFESCATCSNDPYSQVSGAFAYLASDTNWSGGMWISVTTAGSWSNDIKVNQKYFSDVVNNCVTFSLYGLDCGVFTNKNDWTTIFGSADWSCNVPRFSLWYSNNDGIPSFDDFVPFGGYTVPYAKQYSIGNDVCGTRVNFNYIPN